MPKLFLRHDSGWVVTWVFFFDTLHRCSDKLHRCSNTLHRYSDRMLVDFSTFSIYTQKVIHHFPAQIFSPLKRYQDILLKFLTSSTDSVTKKIAGDRAVYFYNSGSIFATKNFVSVRFYLPVSRG